MSVPPSRSIQSSESLRARIRRRHMADRRFRFYGFAAMAMALAVLVLLFVSIVSKAYTAFQENVLTLRITLDPVILDPEGQRDPQALFTADYQTLIAQAIAGLFPAVTDQHDRRLLFNLVSVGAPYTLRDTVTREPALIGSSLTTDVLLSDEADQFLKGYITANVPETERLLKDQQVSWLQELQARRLIRSRFNITLFTAGDSREPELAGISGAVTGSFYLMLVTLSFSFPVGVAAAVYLEEFAPRNSLTDLIEVNVNNLAAVPSVVFGLLGLAIFLNVFGLPRSAPLVGGLVLSLIILPTIVIAARAALKAVPLSIREAALGIGASKMQSILHHVLPLAMPGIMTGTIIGMAHALGESAPLLMIGMVAFVVDTPVTLLDPATVLPVQIYLWADSPERAFVERTAAAIMVLLVFLIAMNTIAVFLRNRFERRW
ncbi:Phosphate transport system permease protein PstA (TC 3.A.1.7.1) [invertebrate metagenome]|uniref:Phosphate transport system permease protein PstA (TC 3.A.1.7.1) n=1 Tax=invertebrate metagenome TaxID=1711999 RepID=A0A484H5Q0_9ZZZZ